jgi:hypothetical protein
MPEPTIASATNTASSVATTARRPIGGEDHQEQSGELGRGKPATPKQPTSRDRPCQRQECERRRDQCPDAVQIILTIESEHPT